MFRAKLFTLLKTYNCETLAADAAAGGIIALLSTMTFAIAGGPGK